MYNANVDHTTTTSQFPVKTAVFEGPLELLIELCEKRKLLINDISLAEVTDEYIKRVAEMQTRSLPNIAQFVSLAATLLLIKSKSLLPVLELTEEEEERIEDLESRLRLYQIFRSAGKTIQTTFGRQVLYGRRFVPPEHPVFVVDTYASTTALREAMDRVLKNLPEREVAKPKASVRKVISLEEMIEQLHERIRNQMNLTFKELTSGHTDKGTVIVSFLAVLESVKQGAILVAQAGRFDDIEISLHAADTPRYY